MQALSWGAEGHEVIAKLAERQLTPKALEAAHHLLELEPGSTMASVSAWADEHHNLRNFTYAQRVSFTNFEHRVWGENSPHKL
jgi:hypothetical protein